MSASGVTPSALKSVITVPAGKVLPESVMSKVSVMVPRLVRTLVNVTVVPGLAVGTRAPVRRRSIVPSTVYVALVNWRSS